MTDLRRRPHKTSSSKFKRLKQDKGLYLHAAAGPDRHHLFLAHVWSHHSKISISLRESWAVLGLALTFQQSPLRSRVLPGV